MYSEGTDLCLNCGAVTRGDNDPAECTHLYGVRRQSEKGNKVCVKCGVPVFMTEGGTYVPVMMPLPSSFSSGLRSHGPVYEPDANHALDRGMACPHDDIVRVDDCEVCRVCARVLEGNIVISDETIYYSAADSLSLGEPSVSPGRLDRVIVMGDLANLPQNVLDLAQDKLRGPLAHGLRTIKQMNCTEEEWIVCVLYLSMRELGNHFTFRDIVWACGQREVQLWRLLGKIHTLSSTASFPPLLPRVRSHVDGGEMETELLGLKVRIRAHVIKCCAYLGLNRREVTDNVIELVSALHVDHFSCPLRSLIAISIYKHVKTSRGKVGFKGMTISKISEACKVSASCIRRGQSKFI
jgi:hypothetical protein